MNILRKENTIIIISVISGLFIVSNLYILIPLGAILTEMYQFSTKELSLNSSAFSLCYAIGFLIWGIALNKWGYRKIVSIGTLMLAICTTLFSMFINKENFIIFRSLQGFTAASFAPSILSFLSMKLKGNKKILALGLISSSFLVSGITGQMLSVHLIKYYNISFIFQILAISYFFICFLLFFSVTEENKDKSDFNIKNICISYVHGITNKALIPYYFITLTLLFSFVAFYTSLGSITKFNISTIRTFSIFGMLVSPLSSYISSIIGKKKTIIYSLLTSAISIIAVLLIPVSLVSILGANLFNAGIALTIPLIVDQIGTISKENRNIAITLYTFILFLGATLGSILSIIISRNINSAFMIYSCSFILIISSLIAIFCVKQSKGFNITDYVDIPNNYILHNKFSFTQNNKPITLYRFTKTGELNLFGEHFSVVIDEKNKLLGLMNLDNSFQEKVDICENEIEAHCIKIFNKYYPGYYEQLTNLWIKDHTEVISDNNIKINITGKKFKCFNKELNNYSWIIINSKGNLITFEKDILWVDGRITEKWLHDSFLKEFIS